MYFPLSIFLIYYFMSRKSNNDVSILHFFVFALIDIHATLCIVHSYELTSITSVMLLTDFAIPSAVFLSLCLLKIKYIRLHYFALGLCFIGMACSLSNDFFIKKNNETNQNISNQILGDILALIGSFGYALNNILMEKYLKN